MRKNRLRRVAAIAVVPLVLILGFLGYQAYYHLAWAGNTEEISFKSGETRIAGLLVKPEGNAPFPAVVILHGSGQADGTHGLPGYRVHANAFLRKGLAVLVYDKRGTGNSGGDFSTAIYDDFVHDAIAAVRFLRGRQDIDPNRVGLLGISEGGWLTPEVATVSGDIAFIINKCGPPLPWDETVLFEIENERVAAGLSPEITQEILELRKRIWKFYVDAAADDAIAKGARRDAINADLTEIHDRMDDPESSGLPDSLPDYDAEAYGRLAADISYDPTPFLHDLHVPMLCVFAENDVNVPPNRSVAVLEEIKNEHQRDIATKIYPNVGHGLFSWKGVTTAGFVGGYLELIGDWARDHTSSP